MYVTPQDFKIQIRELKAEISAVAKDLGGDLQFLHQRISELQDIVTTQQEVINKLSSRLGSNEDIR